VASYLVMAYIKEEIDYPLDTTTTFVIAD